MGSWCHGLQDFFADNFFSDKWDGHTHTEFCRHGDGSSVDEYLQRAVALGFTRYSVTEHPPLPRGWLNDPAVAEAVSMRPQDLPEYFRVMTARKEEYAGRLDVRVGLELDHLPGRERFVRDVVEAGGEALEEAVLSVHFLPGRGGMRCVDLSPDDFLDGLVRYHGTVRRVVEEYFDTVEDALEFGGRLPFPVRIGHPNLILKFRSALPPVDGDWIRDRLVRLLPILERTGVGIDANAAGLRQPTCREPYAPDWFVKACLERGVDVVYGSDAHRPEDVGRSFEWFHGLVEGRQDQGPRTEGEGDSPDAGG